VVIDLGEADVLIGEQAELVDSGLDGRRAGGDALQELAEPLLVDRGASFCFGRFDYSSGALGIRTNAPKKGGDRTRSGTRVSRFGPDLLTVWRLFHGRGRCTLFDAGGSSVTRSEVVCRTIGRNTMTTETLDEARAEAFAGRMIGILNGGVLSLMCSIGHQTGLFDTMAGLPPSTSEQIAKAAGLNERYVREWLGSVVTGGIVEYDASNKTYRLPPEHAVSLTRAAGPGNLAVMTQFTALFGNVEQGIVQSFQRGGGVPYSEYGEFQRLMSELSSQIVDATLLDVTLPLVPGLVDKLKAGIDVADVGCGAGHAVNVMAKAFPNSRFVGYDFSEEGIAAGTAEARSMGLTNARFELKDAATLDGSATFDLICVFDAIHDQAKPARVLAGIADALKPDGVFLCVDIAASSHLEQNLEHPLAPMMYGVSTMHCMTVSLALNGEGLGTMWGEQKAREMFADAGFTDITVKQVEGDIMNNYYIARKT
jgi:SAM-dependent methyltransferase